MVIGCGRVNKILGTSGPNRRDRNVFFVQLSVLHPSIVIAMQNTITGGMCGMLIRSALSFIVMNSIISAVGSFVWTSQPPKSMSCESLSSGKKPTLNIHKQTIRSQSKLFSGGFGNTSNTKSKKQQKPKTMSPNQSKRATQELLQRYGGDIQKGTQSRIDASLASLPPHLQEATTLYKQLTQFDALVAPMTESDKKRLIPLEQWDIASRDRSKFEQLLKEHSLSENDIHNLYQRITWDASADAKATRADIAGNKMKGDLQERISRACSIVVEAVVKTTQEGRTGKVLDIGCGHGSIVPSLVDAGLEELDSYVGIDLSEEMIKNAIDRYGSERNKQGKCRLFIADDFLTHDFSKYVEKANDDEVDIDSLGVFGAVIFCSSLHDLPDMEKCIGRAASLLLPGGKLVVVHAQGAMHVQGQRSLNPVMVQRCLPTAKEWLDMIDKHKKEWKLILEYEPGDPRSDRDAKEGYLAVLAKE